MLHLDTTLMSKGTRPVLRHCQEKKKQRIKTHPPTCLSKPVEATTGSLGDLFVGSSSVSTAGIAGRGCGVHLWFAHIEETDI